MRITTLTPHHIEDVDSLMKSNSATLGFLPREAIKSYLDKNNVIGAFDQRNQLVGYLLYGANRDYFRITHLCVAQTSRKQGIAARLLEDLKSRATSQHMITLNCRRDFPANRFWPKLGFIPLGEKPSRSGEGRVLTRWCLALGLNVQRSLFEAESSTATIDVAIDAQIFFDLVGDYPDRSNESLTLNLDSMADLVNLRVTDEIFVEINRNPDPSSRESNREQANNFHQVRHDIDLFQFYQASLKTILPGNSGRALSDISHLAKTAASETKYFVTRDRALLNRKFDISNLTEVKVLSPTELILQVHELIETTEYTPVGVLGLTLQKRRLRSADIQALPIESLLTPQEGKGEFRGKLDYYLAKPNQFRCDIFEAAREIVAIRIHEKTGNTAIRIHLARACASKNRQLLEPHLIADIIREAVNSRTTMVEFRDSHTFSRLRPTLLRMGFIQPNKNFVRFCFANYLSRESALEKIAEIDADAIPFYMGMSENEIERHLSPLAILSHTNYFLVPIRPKFAISLVDWQQSANTLFGGRENVLLRWDHVYYRSNTKHRMLRPPGRILWYVSAIPSRRTTGTDRNVIAISHLDSVQSGYPKQLFKQFRRKGAFDWKQVNETCKGDPNIKIMAIEFSHTFPFKKPITLNYLRQIYNASGSKLVLQSPSKIPEPVFERLYRFGFEV